jgi:hypothetical protein
VLDLVEEPLDQVASSIEMRAEADRLAAIASRRNIGQLSGGDLNRSTQHLLILLDKEVADGDVTDIVHGEAEG